MKVDIHTHLLLKEWPALEGIEMEIHPMFEFKYKVWGHA
jgi:hypothetical protein